MLKSQREGRDEIFLQVPGQQQRTQDKTGHLPDLGDKASKGRRLGGPVSEKKGVGGQMRWRRESMQREEGSFPHGGGAHTAMGGAAPWRIETKMPCICGWNCNSPRQKQSRQQAEASSLRGVKLPRLSTRLEGRKETSQRRMLSFLAWKRLSRQM